MDPGRTGQVGVKLGLGLGLAGRGSSMVEGFGIGRGRRWVGERLATRDLCSQMWLDVVL